MSDPLSVGLLVGDRDVAEWFAKAVERMEAETVAEVTTILIPDTPTFEPPEKDLRFYVEDVREKGCWTVVTVGRRIADRFLDPLPETRGVPIDEYASCGPPAIESCELLSASEHRYELPESAVQRLSGTDVTFHWGVGIIEGEALGAPTHGIWGVHHGDLRKYRGGPPGFWEFVNDEPVGVSTLQRFTSELDGGDIVLERGIDIERANTWREVRRIMCRETVPMFAEGIERLLDGEPYSPPPDELGPIRSPADRTCKTTVKYAVRTIPGWVRTLVSGTSLSGT